MGEPRKIRKKYSPPRHPWEKTRIDDEKKLTKEYGFGNKKEIWKVTSKLKSFKDRAKKLSALSDNQSEIETKHLLDKLRSINLLNHNQELNDILAVQPASLADRRLQTLVYKKSLARSVKQARQMIVHKHIMVQDTTITSPSFIVDIAQESQISFSPNSPFFSMDHPERFISEEALTSKPEEVEELALKKSKDKKHAKIAKSTSESVEDAQVKIQKPSHEQPEVKPAPEVPEFAETKPEATKAKIEEQA